MAQPQHGIPGPYVEKIRVAARVSQPSSEPRDGHFLLFPSVEDGDRPETLLELLNSSRMVIPFVRSSEQSVLLLTRTNIDWVVVGRGVSPSLVFPPGHVVSNEQRVDLRLIDESHVHAVLQWNSGGGTNRLSDHLNSVEAFIPAVTTFGTLLVNKFRVRETLVEEGTGPSVGPSGASGTSPASDPARGPRASWRK